MEVAEYVLGTQNRKLIIFLQYIYIYIKKRMSQLLLCTLWCKTEGHVCNFSEKGQKRANIWKFGQKCTKFEDILKKCSLMCATITSMKQLQHALNSESASSQEWVELWSFLHVVRKQQKSHIYSIISGGCGQTCPKWFKTTS